LSVILIQVPSLKDRKDDIPLLVDKFLDDIAQDSGYSKKGITKEAIKKLQEFPWTGNIRELRNVVERLVILGEPTITLEDIKKYADY
jgi:DNA-binding NtrC family response regulator